MSSVFGAWDLTVFRPSGEFPSWFELTELGGRYVGIWGSTRPIETIQLEGDRLVFELPSQYEGIDHSLRFELAFDGDNCAGFATIWDEEPYPVSGTRATSMEREGEPKEGETVDLLHNGLDGFVARWADMDFNWSFEDGVLINGAKGTDIITKECFADFRLEAEYQYPAGSNSGIYLRGRYEFQILDDHGQTPSVGSSGAIYGFYAPSENAIYPAESWNRAVIELIGRQVKIELNGRIILEARIPGITGGALDSSESTPGPILLQGDHGPVSFRRLVLTPIEY